MSDTVDYTLERVLLKSKVEKQETQIELLKSDALRALTHLNNGQHESAEFILKKMVMTVKPNGN